MNTLERLVANEDIQYLFGDYGLNPKDIVVETKIQDLELDSLDVISMIIFIEDEFDIGISDEDALSFETVGDIVKYIEENTCN